MRKQQHIIVGCWATIFLLFILVVSALVVGALDSTASNPNQERACVFLGVEATSVLTYYTNSAGVHNYMRQTGLRVAWVDRSQHAPQVNVGAPLADTIAYLLEAGMVQRGEGTYLMFTR